MSGKGFAKNNWFILILFGMLGQIAWSVENMYFNLFVFDRVSQNLDAITLMVQLSGITATLVTLVAGTLSDRAGNRRKFISVGYIVWGVTVAVFGFISPELVAGIFNTGAAESVLIALVLVIVGDCVMTMLGSLSNDAAFNAWVTDNTTEENRTKVEGVLSVLPLIALLIVAGGFGMLAELLDYDMLFLALGVLIIGCGVLGIFTVKDSPTLTPSGSMKDIFYGFKPSVARENKPFYVSLLVVGVYGIACQIFMPYMIIYMREYLGFSTLEYSIVFGLAIALGALVNIFLTRNADRWSKIPLLYIAAGIMTAGLLAMYFSRNLGHVADLILFGVSGFVMITGYIFVSALVGATLRDHTPSGAVGKLQGVRMVFSVLIPMIVGPLVGNTINKAMNIPLSDTTSADVMTTSYVPAPEIFLAAAICTALIFAIIPLLSRVIKRK